MRQRPEVPSATHKCLTGWLVTGLSAVPSKTIPPVGPVIGLCASGVPANWIVLVVGLMVVWAFAEKVANVSRITMQSITAAEFPRRQCLLCANDATIPEGLNFLAFPSGEP